MAVAEAGLIQINEATDLLMQLSRHSSKHHLFRLCYCGAARRKVVALGNLSKDRNVKCASGV